MHPKRHPLRWIVVEVDSQRPIAVLDGCQHDLAQQYAQEMWGPAVSLTTPRHASENQRSIAGRLRATSISSASLPAPLRMPAGFVPRVRKPPFVETAAELLREKWKGEKSMTAGGGA